MKTNIATPTNHQCNLQQDVSHVRTISLSRKVLYIAGSHLRDEYPKLNNFYIKKRLLM